MLGPFAAIEVLVALAALDTLLNYVSFIAETSGTDC